MSKSLQFDNIVKLLCSEGADFKLRLSANSQIIIKDKQKAAFNNSRLNPKIFHIAKKIKNEADIFLHYNPEFRNGDKYAIRYYNYNKIPSKLKRFYFIDISSCYITCLKNAKIISNNLFDEINSLPKSERLISLGMLAYEPYEIEYENGKRKSIKKVGNEYSHVFYHACYLTMLLMENIIKLIGNEYLFYWVDGIFFKDQYHYYIIRDYLSSLGFKFKCGSCYNLRSKDKGNYIDMKFYQFKAGNKQAKKPKDRNDKLEFKVYNMPHYFEDYIQRRKNYELILKEDYESLLLNYKEQLQKGEIR